MKRSLRVSIICFVVSLFILTGSEAIYAQSDATTIQAFVKEDDWRLIRDLHVEIMDKLVYSAVSLSAMNFSDEGRFLSLLGITRSQYLAKAEVARIAARRLITKYQISEECIVCSTRNDPVKKFQTIVSAFQNDKVSYERYRSGLISERLADEPNRCCGLRFYLCCTVCAATIAAFPAYLACCALCFDTYCCKLK